ncbi:hypothetical protein [Thalassotalea crassostreae]|uniref:sulfotransferase-like domain-containing protein n=1 Tax=Thalassotalea crassostreae TaxID=1763536 RepID=UPI0008A62178|nr:hypothetical protein [Thalassotalea crassostreae]
MNDITTTRIAMWSGPRNISTAMMRSFENRTDSAVVDEPFYAYYLAQTKLKHPMYQQILASQSNRWQDVVEQLLTDHEIENNGREVFYQKHMTHHMLKDIDLDWTNHLKHCFLIRNPLYVINSYVKKMPSVNNDDIGIVRQYELYQQLCEITQSDIPIIDSKDVLENPESVLSQLCQQLDIPFEQRMLSWPKGRRDSDGVWSSHWYQNVENSERFGEFIEPVIQLTDQQKALADENDKYYQALYSKRIKPES